MRRGGLHRQPHFWEVGAMDGRSEAGHKQRPSPSSHPCTRALQQSEVCNAAEKRRDNTPQTFLNGSMP
jgi:hypothetical protein